MIMRTWIRGLADAAETLRFAARVGLGMRAGKGWRKRQGKRVRSQPLIMTTYVSISIMITHLNPVRSWPCRRFCATDTDKQDPSEGNIIQEDDSPTLSRIGLQPDPRAGWSPACTLQLGQWPMVRGS